MEGYSCYDSYSWPDRWCLALNFALTNAVGFHVSASHLAGSPICTEFGNSSKVCCCSHPCCWAGECCWALAAQTNTGWGCHTFNLMPVALYIVQWAAERRYEDERGGGDAGSDTAVCSPQMKGGSTFMDLPQCDPSVLSCARNKRAVILDQKSNVLGSLISRTT